MVFSFTQQNRPHNDDFRIRYIYTEFRGFLNFEFFAAYSLNMKNPETHEMQPKDEKPQKSTENTLNMKNSKTHEM